MLPDPETTPLLTVEQLVAAVPAVGKKSSVYAAIDAGQIPSLRFGRRVLIPVAALRRAWGLDSPINSEDPAPTAESIATTTSTQEAHHAGSPTTTNLVDLADRRAGGSARADRH